MRNVVRQVKPRVHHCQRGRPLLATCHKPHQLVPSSAVLGDDRSCGGHCRSGGGRAPDPAKPAPAPPPYTRGLAWLGRVGRRPFLRPPLPLRRPLRSGGRAGHRVPAPAAPAATPLAPVPAGLPRATVLGGGRSRGGCCTALAAAARRPFAEPAAAATPPESMPRGSAQLGRPGRRHQLRRLLPGVSFAQRRELPHCRAPPRWQVVGSDGGVDSAAATGPEARGASGYRQHCGMQPAVAQRWQTCSVLWWQRLKQRAWINAV
ncbi:unnamed protein product [Prorocentrum cordatum]|uniref:Uncharacterized protein n=1 Tax=Prorocentrum cordatum TaxID=2364126 RepID=A0ABN9UV77_9DINO|nr:unnamed protein product [Polarella glacialis]